jgi:hypothetical protein
MGRDYPIASQWSIKMWLQALKINKQLGQVTPFIAVACLGWVINIAVCEASSPTQPLIEMSSVMI